MKLNKSVRLANGIVIPRGTTLKFSNEGFAKYKNVKVPLSAIESQLSDIDKFAKKTIDTIRAKFNAGVFSIKAFLDTFKDFDSKSYVFYNGTLVVMYDNKQGIEFMLDEVTSDKVTVTGDYEIFKTK